MNLHEVIINCSKYIDTDELMHMVFSKRHENKFEANSEAIVLSLTLEEMEMNLSDIANSKCPGYHYFLEIFIIQDFFKDLVHLDEYKSDDDKVNRVIYYAEFDA